jgi:hypothetical protein
MLAVMMITEKLVVDEDDARDNLDAIVRQRGERYALLSRLMGQPDGYLRRWARGEKAARLPDEIRYQLARYLSVDARLFGVPLPEAPEQAPLPRRARRKPARQR